MPRVSIVILSHRPELMPEAFRSAVNQTYKDREIVVKFFDGEWWPEKLNEAIRGTSGEQFAVLCDDDSLAPTWLARCVEAMDFERTPIAYTDNQVFGLMDMRYALPDFSRDILALHCVPHFTALTSRQLWEDVGGYDGTQQHVDWDFWATCAEHGATAAHVREHLFGYRVTHTNSSRAFNDADAMALLRRKHPWIAATVERVKIPLQAA